MRSTEEWAEWLRKNGERLLPEVESIHDWYRLAGVEKGERRYFRAALKGAGLEGGRRRKGRNATGPRTGAAAPAPSYSRGSDGATWEGRLRLTREGRLILIPDLPGAPVVKIPSGGAGDALPKDTVQVRLEKRRGGAPPFGRVVRVVERGIRAFVGRYVVTGGRTYVRFRDREADLHVPVTLPAGVAEPSPGELVLAEVTTYPGKGREGEASVLRGLGSDYTMETLFLAVAASRDLPVEFSPEAQAEAAGIPDTVSWPAPDRSGEGHPPRVDERHLPYVTIDGEDAKDFDDAVCLREEGGRFLLSVAIADVSHYVRPGSPLDRDAYRRGTSVYFPDRAVPMLPPALSEGVCSLKPLVDRLAVTVEIPLGREGRPAGRPSFHPSVIRSRARLTYEAVHRFLETGERGGIPPEAAPMLSSMDFLAKALTAIRSARGGLDFDLPEARIRVEGGMPVAVEAYPRWESHRLIEEFMLLANNAVAVRLNEGRLPFLSRIHEPPDERRIEEFEEAASKLLRRARVTTSREIPARLKAWADAARGSRYEKQVNMLLLRSLMLARYAPGPEGHFGLALPAYAHFTSPIRRYPDLLVHRILKAGLGDPSFRVEVDRMEAMGEEMGGHLSSRERLADEAERDVEARAKALFMTGRTGREYDGVVVSVVKYGMFVELAEDFVEGFLHVSSLRDDEYRYSSDHGELVGTFRRKRFGPGDRLRVRVYRADVDRGEVELRLVEKMADTP
jgi:ribonuclease R